MRVLSSLAKKWHVWEKTLHDVLSSVCIGDNGFLHMIDQALYTKL